MLEPLGVVLAGGRGTRLGGVGKAGLRLGNATLLERVCARLEPQVARLAVNTNTTIKTAHPVIADKQVGYLGPLAGVLAGLEWANAQGGSHVVTVAVDTPFFPCDLVPQLILAGATHPDGFAIAATADGPHPTFGIWPVTLIGALASFLANGHRKVTQFTTTQGAAMARFPDTQPPSFFNINTPDDLTIAAGWL